MPDKVDVAEIVTARIIEAMEAGKVPWHKPWTAQGGPTSLATGKPYRGFNELVLDWYQQSKGYSLPLWGTWKQAEALGGNVKADEAKRYEYVVLFKRMTKEDPATGKDKAFFMMRYFRVYNVDQMENIEIPERFLTQREPVPVLVGVDQALHYPGGPEVRHQQQDRAYYEPGKDRITLPLLEQFKSASGYAGTALHEAVHSTGHESRLKRLDTTAFFGCENYAKEELVAEVGAAMLASRLGIDVEWEQHGAYVSSWLKALKDDRKLLIGAAQRAAKAVDHIMGTTVKYDDSE